MSKWIQEAKLKKGAFTEKAKKHNMGVQEYAGYVLAHKDNYDKHTILQASLAKTFSKMK